MKKLIILGMIFLLNISIALAEDAVWKSITAEEILSKLDTVDAYEFVDTRSADMYASSHIPYASNVWDEGALTQFFQNNNNLSADIYIYGDDTSANEKIAGSLLTNGYTSVYIMGPFTSWNYVTYSSADEEKLERIMGMFETTDIDGNTVTESVFESHNLTMINIWATYCNPCLSEMPDLAKLNNELASNGFQIIGLVTDIQDGSMNVDANQLALAKEIIDQTQATYLHILPSDDLYYSFLSKVTAVPCTFFVDNKGDLVGSVYYGAKSYDQWHEIINQLLEAIQR